jgi:hypothetical protein
MMSRAQTRRCEASRRQELAVADVPSEFTLLVGPRGEGWVDLRNRLARSARELHFVAVASQSENGSSILTIAGRLAELAMSIPMRPEGKAPGDLTANTLVSASTLFAAQIQQYDDDADRKDADAPVGTAPDI